MYNPQVLKRVTEFFSLHHDKLANDFSVSELKLTTAARARYEVLKQQTKAELQLKWDQILDGEDKTVSKLNYFGFLFFLRGMGVFQFQKQHFSFFAFKIL